MGYHREKKLHILSPLIPALIMVAVLIVLSITVPRITSANIERERGLLENAIERSVVQCYALEGTYPPSIGYLEEHYGLQYDEDSFIVDYRYIGGNIRPNVTVLERK